jgi:hypothetical protein
VPAKLNERKCYTLSSLYKIFMAFPVLL